MLDVFGGGIFLGKHWRSGNAEAFNQTTHLRHEKRFGEQTAEAQIAGAIFTDDAATRSENDFHLRRYRVEFATQLGPVHSRQVETSDDELKPVGLRLERGQRLFGGTESMDICHADVLQQRSEKLGDAFIVI